MPLEETDISKHPDELVRRILFLTKYHNSPMTWEDEGQLMDILKTIAVRILAIENVLAGKK